MISHQAASDYFAHNMTGGPDRCLPFYHQAIKCYTENPIYNKVCQYEFNDFGECRTGSKQKWIDQTLSFEMHKQNVVHLPRYDDLQDKFVSDVEFPNADEIFNMKQAMTKEE